jgi:ATP-dependent DNA helicase RecG
MQENTVPSSIDPFSFYEKIPDLKEAQIKKLHKLCGPRLVDLCLHMPTGTIDRRNLQPLYMASAEMELTATATVAKHIAPYQKGRQPHRIQVTDGTATADLVFFNFGSWFAKQYPEGSEIVLSGEATFDQKGSLQFLHPTLSKAENRDEIAKLHPTYPLTAGINQFQIAKAISWAMGELSSAPLPEWLPESSIKQHELPSFMSALNSIHSPEDGQDIAKDGKARTRLAFDEFYCWQIALTEARKHTQGLGGITHSAPAGLTQSYMHGLPFALTGDQKKAIADIHHDMEQSAPMLRLVQGDVGSGKTVVGFAAMVKAVENGHQAALLAPTEILAGQHFENAKKMLEPLGITVEFLAGKQKASEKRSIKSRLKSGFIDVVSGTHAILQKDVEFHNLSLAVIDEQHRFGVRQRMNLQQGDYQPDLLVMTATPIPRTLAMTAYGDMDISIIAEKPPGRTPITTRALPLDKLGDVAESLKRVLEKGEQAYWVCPLVEDSEKSDLAAAADRAELLQQFYGNDVGLLHGKMKSDQKDLAMQTFKDAHTKILVSTTVIEVGVDVPNATVMVIEHAERFGLAQLHQLRGRIGRGSLQSSCILLYKDPPSKYAKERIDTLRNSEDGFVLAEKDLELRGPGEILGTRQSGFGVTRLADFSVHKELVSEARDAARETLSTGLTPEQSQALLWLMHIFEKQDAVKLLASG